MKKTTRIRVNFRLPDNLVIWGRQYAAARGCSFTEVVQLSLIMLQNYDKREEEARAKTAITR